MSREMKDSGIPWIGEIPKDWGNLKFKYSGSFQKGKLPKEFNVEGNGYPIIGASEMLGKTPRLYSLEADLPVCDIEDILILWDGANAGIVSTNHKGIISSTTVRYSCADKRCSSGYVFYLFKSVEPYFREKVFGTTIPHMNMEYINDVPLLLPTLAEQKAIAEFLDRKCGDIDELVSLQEQMIEELKAYKQSVITEAVTKGLNPNVPLKDSGIEWIGQIPEHWDILPIKTISKSEKYSIKTGPFGSQLKGEELKTDGDVRVYNQRNVIDNDFDNINYFITYEKADELRAFYTKPNDILITSRGTIGKASLLTEKHKMGILHPCLIALRIDERKANLRWVLIWINESEPFEREIEEKSNGTTIGVIYTDTLKNIRIVVPPLAEQQEIADYLDKKCSEIDSLIELKQQKIEELKDYQKSLIYEYVTGKKQIS